MGNRVDHPAAPLLVGVEDHEHVGKRWVGHDPGGAQRIRAMNEEITNAQLCRHANYMEASVSSAAETFSKFGYRLVSHRSGHSVNGTIWPQAAVHDLPEHG